MRPEIFFSITLISLSRDEPYATECINKREKIEYIIFMRLSFNPKKQRDSRLILICEQYKVTLMITSKTWHKQ